MRRSNAVSASPPLVVRAVQPRAVSASSTPMPGFQPHGSKKASPSSSWTPKGLPVTVSTTAASGASPPSIMTRQLE
ncbi:hypothetical protein [Nocardiopsis dassonvillei]|uniref:hypothetical protein n=1 Tax=Nocardiopsis dassonvillei TaxID=2014 RepID=UPI0020102A4B|nr:hypothetical protein [Nocardiopsis dassonvillei]